MIDALAKAIVTFTVWAGAPFFAMYILGFFV